MENISDAAFTSQSLDTPVSAEYERILEFFHALVFSPYNPKEIPEVIGASAKGDESARALIELRNALRLASKGDFSYKITSKGFIGGSLKGLQANLNHVAWLTRCVADGDLDQQMDFMGDFSDAFNDMVKRLSSTLQTLEHERKTLSDLADNLRREIEARKKTEIQLREKEERWEMAVQCSQDGIWEADLTQQSQMYWSPRFIELLRVEPENCDALFDVRNISKLFHRDDHELLRIFRRLITGRNPPVSFELDHKLLCGDGQYRWFMTRGMVVFDQEKQKPARVIGVTVDIQSRKEREESFSYRATHDALTDLPNRVLFDAHLKNGVEFIKRRGTHLAVIMMDLDKFKTVNDTMGHYVGDLLLIEVARRLQKNVRESDIVSRFGGDEFALVLAFEKGELYGATKALKRIMASLSAPMLLDGKTFTIGASMGLCICPEYGITPKELMLHADEALYYVKAEGRNACAFWRPDKQHKLIRFS